MTQKPNQIEVRAVLAGDKKSGFSFLTKIKFPDRTAREFQCMTDFATPELAKAEMDKFTQDFGPAMQRGKIVDHMNRFNFARLPDGTVKDEMFPPDLRSSNQTVQLGEA